MAMRLERGIRWHRENDLEGEKQRLHEKLLREGKLFPELDMARSETDKSVLVVNGSYTEAEKAPGESSSPAMDKSNPEGGRSQLEDDMAERDKSTPVADADTSAGTWPPAADTPHSADDTQQAEEPHNQHRLPHPQ